MKKKGNAGSRFWAKRLTALALALLTLMSCMGTAFAEETPQTPAAAQDTYVVDNITYYNVSSPNFAAPAKYFRDLMGTRSSALDNRSMAQRWMEAGVGLVYSSDTIDQTDGGFNVDKATAVSAMLQGIDTGSYTVGSFKTGSTDAMYATSIADAAERLKDAVPREMSGLTQSFSDNFNPYNKNNAEQKTAAEKKQDVIAAVCYGYQSNCLMCVQVYFTDFQAVALLPDNSGTNYVTTKLKDNKKSERTYASNVKNMTLAPVTATQNVSTSWSTSVTSTVNHSDSYSLSEAVKLGMKFTFTVAEFSPEVSISSTQAYTNGWSKSTAETKSGTVSETVSVSLPPYTNILLEQGSSSTEAETRYNCPIGLRYKATVRKIVLYSHGNNLFNVEGFNNYTFGPDARADLYKRAIQNGDLNADTEGVNWVKAMNTTGGSITSAATHVPMSPTGATFTETRDTTFTEVKSIAPLEPLAVVKILPPDVNFVNGQTLNYNNLNYLHVDMKAGESSYTNYLKLRGENSFGAEYYGFSYRYGHWVVIHPDGTEWTDDTAPVKLEKDPATGYIRYTAIRPGTCFLKYIIDENSYSTVNDPGAYTKNSDLVSTAALEITVSGVKEETKPTGTITVSGNFFGFVGADPTALDGPDGLAVSIRDMTGKEIDKQYVWEKQELDSRGIRFSDDNKVSFTKTGTYHVRVVCDEIAAKSDWYEIEVHDYTFTAEGASIMASCTDPQCDDVMFTVHSPAKTVYGDGKSAWASVTGKIPGLSTPAVEYYRGTEKLSAPPRDAGAYSARITIGGATAEVAYKIAQAEAVITVPPTASPVTVGDSLYSSILTGGEANTAGSFAWTDTTIRPALEDGDTTLYQVTFTPQSANYMPSVCTITVPVVIARPDIKVRPGSKALVYTGEAQELVWPGEAENANMLYAVSEQADIDPETLAYAESIPTAVEAGTYYIWYGVTGPDDIHIQSVPVTTVIQKAVPWVEFPVTQLLARDEEQPLIVDPIVSPSEGVTVYYSLGDTENEIVDSPMGRALGVYEVYYRIESSTPSCESVPYGDPVHISIQTALEEQLPELQVSLADWTYGEEPELPVVSGNKGYPVSFRYRKQLEDDAAYTETVPTDAGAYVVEASVSSGDYWGTVTATASFSIKKRVPVLDEDYFIKPGILAYDGSYRPLVDSAVKDETKLRLWYSFDKINVLAGTPKKRDPGTYEIWYKVSGDSNYEEMTDWSGPVVARILSPITVSVKDGAKFFDGKPMENEYFIEGMPEGCVAENIVFSGSITEVGSKSVRVTKISIIDEQGNDISDACRFVFIPGLHVVLDEPDFIAPAMLKGIGPEAFAGIGAESILLPESVKEVAADAFGDCEKLTAFIVCGAETEIDNEALMGSTNVTVYAPAGSLAQTFAEDNGISFIPLLNQAG